MCLSAASPRFESVTGNRQRLFPAPYHRDPHSPGSYPYRRPTSLPRYLDWDSLTVEGNLNLTRLLMCLGMQFDSNPAAHVDVIRCVEAEQLPLEEAVNLAGQLEQQGLTNVSCRGLRVVVQLTEEGHLAVRHLKALQQDRAARLRYVLDTVLHWMFRNAHDQAPIDPTRFLSTPGAYFAGAPLSSDDLAHALGRLEQHHLLESMDTDPDGLLRRRSTEQLLHFPFRA